MPPTPRAHSFIFGAQPDYLTSVVTDEGIPFPFVAHGRELTAGDAEKVLDGSTSTAFRALSVGSGEYNYFQMTYADYIPLVHQVSAIVSNLDGVGAKARWIAGSALGVVSRVLPAGTAIVGGTTNTTAITADVAQDPFGTVSTFAAPTTTGSDWSIEVPFANTDPLQLSVTQSQIIHVYLKFNGDYDTSLNTGLVTIEVKEGATVRATKNLRIRPPVAVGLPDRTYVIAVLVDPNDFTDKTLTDMSVKVFCAGISTGVYWSVGSISWVKVIASGLQQDTGWKVGETGDSYGLQNMNRVTHGLAFKTSQGVLTGALGPYLFWMVYWDDSVDSFTRGRPRLFFDPDQVAAKQGAPQLWRPEVYLLTEGIGLGTADIGFNGSIKLTDRDVVMVSKGGDEWVVRRGERKRSFSVTMMRQEDIALSPWLAYLRRAGQSRPFVVIYRAENDTLAATFAMYARLRWSTTPTERTVTTPDELAAGGSQGVMHGRFSLTLDFEEVG